MIGAIILQVILIALNAVFTCAETAIVSLNDNQLEEMAKRDEAKAALLSGFKAKQERFFNSYAACFNGKCMLRKCICGACF